MNELINIKNGHLVVTSRQIAGDFEILQGLEEICKKSFTTENKLELAFVLDKLPFNFRHEYPFIMQAITTQIFHNYLSCLEKESDMKDAFVSKLKEYLPEASLISKINNSKHQPDLWLSIDGEEIPVEIKKTVFDERALQQLQRYMFVYKCKLGIAIAKKLKCDLPTNIMFIQFDE